MISPAPHVTLESKLAFLRQPDSYAGGARRVEAIETHMSWVFLTDGHAYKLKKPVRQDLFDFRRLAARRHYCEEELRLNRRLAPDVYLGIDPLCVDALGRLHLGRHGTVVDWLVRMRRLPRQHMLDQALRHASASPADIRRVAARLTRFYRGCVPVLLDPAAYRAGFLRSIELNLRELSRPAYGLPAARVAALCRAQRAVLEDRREWFDRRASEGKIVEGHGDLRPEHVFLGPPVSIIDCLEFSRALRLIDPADELGFLALECERLRASAAGALLLRTYGELSGDVPGAALVHFYQGYRASTRARIAIRHLDEAQFRDSPTWLRRALRYLRLAERHQASINSVIEPPP